MEKNQTIVLVLAVLISLPLIILVPEGLFYAGVVMLIAVALIMSMSILSTSSRMRAHPEIICALSEDAKSVMVKNTGEAEAQGIHIALVPLNIEFDLPSLAPETASSFALPEMIREAKAVVTYHDTGGRTYSHSSPLSALHPGGENDLLKPAFPMFGWKDEK
ncbi:MAG: hypothetical protein GKC04_07275 [Methanomicrobiales archaeon]|nr:hypothetical protein [Methanomicrobiales archaeon]